MERPFGHADAGCQGRHVQGCIQIRLYPLDHIGKWAVGLHLRLEQRTELRLVAGATGIEHEAFRDLAGDRSVEVVGDHGQGHVDAGGHSG